MNKNILIISSNEICYNPRLIKAADYLYSAGNKITVFNTITGIADKNFYKEFINSKKWTVNEFDISKRSIVSKLNWLVSSLSSKIYKIIWIKFNINYGFKYILNRGLIGFRQNSPSFDLIIINLVDNLPFAALLKKGNKTKLIYDSQEYFSGMSLGDVVKEKWVNFAERKYIDDVDLLITTTNVMKQKISDKYSLDIPIEVVRNAPFYNQEINKTIKTKDVNEPLRLVWHGFQVSYYGSRGTNIIVDALSLCKYDFELTLQGRLVEKNSFEDVLKEKEIFEFVKFKDQEHPEKIVESLVNYHVGLIAEPGSDENQRLTSSNKLFEYIHAGLAVIVPDLPGIIETVEKNEIGLIYKTGDAQDFSKCIDKLNNDNELLKKFSKNSFDLSKEINWENDYKRVLKFIEDR